MPPLALFAVLALLPVLSFLSVSAAATVIVIVVIIAVRNGLKADCFTKRRIGDGGTGARGLFSFVPPERGSLQVVVDHRRREGHT